jgi:hypothetical protein
LTARETGHFLGRATTASPKRLRTPRILETLQFIARCRLASSVSLKCCCCWEGDSLLQFVGLILMKRSELSPNAAGVTT